MLSKLFESLYSKVYVSIVVGRSQTTVYIEMSKNGVTNSAEEVFETLIVNSPMQEFINSYTSETPFFYIAILDTSNFQGAAPTCSGNLSNFFDVSSSKYICYNDEWSYYTAKPDLYSIDRIYSKFGIDFVFSPFIILTRFFKDKIGKSVAMFIVIEENYISLAVFNKSKLLYADHIHIQQSEELEDLLVDENSEDDEELSFGGSVDLENIDVDADMGELDDFGDMGDIEDLDSLEDMDDFSDMKEEEISEVKEDGRNLDIKTIESFNEDYERFLLIQNSINRFYKDDKYESIFVENTFIADGLDGGNDLKKYLEEEMFLNVVVRRIHLGAEICDLTKAELK
jgi:hypothetical protein